MRLLSKLAKARLDADPALLSLATRAQPAGTAVLAWAPYPESPQAAAVESDADQIGFGGAAGGGKSDLQIGMASTLHKRAIIFRRVFPSLRGMIERSRELFNAAARSHLKDSYNEQLHVWRFDNGKMLEFGSAQYEQDLKKYQGQPHDYLGIDEATEFPERYIRFLMGWNRTADPEQRCRLVLTFNPPMDSAGEWVVAFFAPWLDDTYPDPADDGEIRYVARVDDRDVFYRTPEDADEDHRPFLKKRTFFHASLKDNPVLLASGYESTIEALPEPLRSLLKGNFHAARIVDPWQVIPTAWVKAAQARWTAEQPDSSSLSSVGVDVARGGKDKTVLARFYGRWVAPLDKYPGISTPNGQSVAALATPYSGALMGLFIDVIGVGASAYDMLRSNGLRVQGVNFAEAEIIRDMRDKSGRLKFRNVRAAAYWKLREALAPETGEALALPPDPELLADLTAAKWELTAGGVLIESKEDISERLGRSPDCGDAIALGYWGIKHGRSNSAVGAFG